MKWVWVALILALVTHVLYIPNGFTFLDHNDTEQEQALVPVGEIGSVFFNRFGTTSFYRPLAVYWHTMDFALWGKWPVGYHLTSVVLHILATLTVGVFLARFVGMSFGQSWIGASLFGVSNMSWWAVGRITAQQEELMVIGLLLALIFYVRRSAWSVVFVLVALGAKETAVVLFPVMALGHDVITKHRLKYALLAALGTAFATYVWLRHIAVPETWRGEYYPLDLWHKVGTNLAILGQLIGKIVTPVKPEMSDAVFVTSPLSVWPMVALGVGLGLVGMMWGKRKNAQVVVLGLMFGLSWGTAANIVPVPRLNSPHYGYILAVPFVGLIALGLQTKLWRMGVGIWGVIMASTTLWAGQNFKNDLTLFGPEVNSQPYYLEGHYYLGNYLNQQGDLAGAQKQYELGLVDYPGLLAFDPKTAMQINLAGVSLQQGQIERADKLYIEAWDSVSEIDRPYIAFNRALIAYQQQKFTLVIEWLTKYPLDIPQAQALLEDAQTKKKD